MSPIAVALCLTLAAPLAAEFLSPEDTLRVTSPDTTPAYSPQPAQSSPSYPPPSADSFFSDFAAYGREKNVILTWHLVAGRATDKRMQIYRFTEEPRVIHDVSRGTLIAKLTGEINLYEDVPPARGTYYYAIFVETMRGLEPGSFTMSRNLVGPVNYQGGPPAPRPSTEGDGRHKRPDFYSQEIDGDNYRADDDIESRGRGINGIIRRTYMKGDYAGTVRALKPFMRNASPRVRAKAMFYTGLARYRLEQYDRAMKYFEHPLTVKYYRSNAEFWIKRTSENLR